MQNKPLKIFARRGDRRCKYLRRLCIGTFCVATASYELPANAQYLTNTTPSYEIRNTFGELGMLDMPSARMAQDGQLSFTAGALGSTERFTLAFQALPWLEGSFRYSRIGHWFTDPHYYDRSFGFKLRLLKEDDILPDLSVGARDFVGSGIYSSEYLAATKSVGPFDLTAGLGWGRLADNSTFSNVFGEVFSSFNTRGGANSNNAGVVDTKSLFHGPSMGLFGGAAWHTPIDGLSLLAEYSSDQYFGERNSSELKYRSPVNVGLSYSASESFALSAGWFYGNTYGLTVTVKGQPTKTYPALVRIGPELPPPAIRSENEQQSALAALQADHQKSQKDRDALLSENDRLTVLQAFHAQTSGVRNVEVSGASLLVDARLTTHPTEQCSQLARIAQGGGKIFKNMVVTDFQATDGRTYICQAETDKRPQTLATADGFDIPVELQKKLTDAFAKQDLRFDAARLKDGEIWIYFENYRYEHQTEAVKRVIRVLMAEAPPTVEVFHAISVFLGVPNREITVTRNAVETAIVNSAPAYSLGNALNIGLPAMETPGLRQAIGQSYPIFSWSLDPKFTQRLFDPAHPIQFMAYGELAGLLEIAPGLAISADLTGQIWTNFTYWRDAGSELPHVRTDILKYLDKGKYGIAGLDLEYRTRLRKDVYAEFHAGLLEDMFAGVGGQLLWRPENSRLAIGADFYQVWQRDYDRLFSLRDYKTFTGHVSVYYDTPFHDITVAVHAGRYLAGDNGATFEILREFSTGVRLGAWATFTNVPFNKFGEGSFDKGIILHIPFQWGLPVWSQSSYDMRLSPLTRDGGQRLIGDDTLYDSTRRASYSEITEHLDDLVEP